MTVQDHILAHLKCVGCSDMALMWDAMSSYDGEVPPKIDFKCIVLEMIRDGQLQCDGGAIGLPAKHDDIQCPACHHLQPSNGLQRQTCDACHCEWSPPTRPEMERQAAARNAKAKPIATTAPPTDPSTMTAAQRAGLVAVGGKFSRRSP